MKYTMTKSNRLIFKKHRYDKKEYIIKVLKNANFILGDDETYKGIANEILKKDIICYTRYINDFVNTRVLNKKPQIKIFFHPPCLNKVENDNYCDIHQDKINL